MTLDEARRDHDAAARLVAEWEPELSSARELLEQLLATDVSPSEVEDAAAAVAAAEARVRFGERGLERAEAARVVVARSIAGLEAEELQQEADDRQAALDRHVATTNRLRAKLESLTGKLWFPGVYDGQAPTSGRPHAGDGRVMHELMAELSSVKQKQRALRLVAEGQELRSEQIPTEDLPAIALPGGLLPDESVRPVWESHQRRLGEAERRESDAAVLQAAYKLLGLPGPSPWAGASALRPWQTLLAPGTQLSAEVVAEQAAELFPDDEEKRQSLVQIGALVHERIFAGIVFRLRPEPEPTITPFTQNSVGHPSFVVLR